MPDASAPKIAVPRFMRLLIILIPAITGAVVASQHHAMMVISHYLGGRTGNCTFGESFEGEALSRLQMQNVAGIREASRIVKHDERYSLWETPNGSYWMPTASGGAVMYDLGEQMRNIYGAGATGVQAGDIVLDCGANVGVFTRKSLNAGAKLVVAIEPAPENLECLRRNFKNEIAAGKVIVYAKGVWNKDDVLNLSVDPVNSARDTFVRPIDDAQMISVPLTTIDKLVRELHLPRVDFIKMDIEGAEQKAVMGATQTIAKFGPRMALCIYHLKDDQVMVPRLVMQAKSDYHMKKSCLCAADRVQPEVALFY
jgi:FkbM family methyltransferase